MKFTATNTATGRFAILLIAALVSSTIAVADEPLSVDAAEVRPELVSCEIGSVSFRIDGPKLWTLSGFNYKNHSIATTDSAYGTVLNIDGVGLLGTAHFLNVPGQPGKIEKENVTALQFFVDRHRVRPVDPQAELKGHAFRLMRSSEIRAVRLESEVSVENDVLVETVRMQASEDTRLKLSYPLMYAWSPAMTDYLFGDDTGILKRGSFLAEGAKPGEGLERTARWMAVYDSADGCGAVCLLTQHPASEDVWFQYTDAPGIYRKLRLMSFSEKTLPAGFDGTYQATIGFFSAEPATWEETALDRLRALQSAKSQRN
ncbi:MAG: hypothetical protein U0936_28295 [Planctomycetaceae bacterium]